MSPPARRSPLGPVLAVVFALLVSACGSTVQQSGGGALAGPGGAAGSDGLGGAGTGTDPLGSGIQGPDLNTGVSGGPTGSDAFGGALGPGGGSSVAGGAGTTSGPDGPGGPSSTGGAGGVPRGVTATGPIKVGFLFSSDLQKTGSQFGLKGIVTGDTEAQYRAIGADLNKRGGVLGRKVELLGHDISTANQLRNPSEEENKACEAFVQDKKVFAVLGSGVFLSPCLAKNGIPSIQGGQFQDAKTIDRDLIYDGGGMLTNVLAKAFIDRLVAQKYFTGWDTLLGAPGKAPVKVGVIYQDIPIFKNYYVAIKVALRRYGITIDPDNEFLYNPTVDGVTSQSQAAVLKFKADGVTHVFGAAFFFFQAAENQNYRPRYGFDSLVPPGLTAANVGPEQLEGALGVGWRPTQDVNQPQDPGPVSAQATRCTKIMKDAGEDLSARTVTYLSHVYCEQLWSFAAALTKGGAVSLPALRAGFDRLGSPVPVVSFGERWGPDRHASNTTVADLGYLTSCNCFAYTKARTRF